MITAPTLSAQELQTLKQQHPEIFSQQRRYLRTLGIIAVAIALYYLFFFQFFGISWPQFVNGCQQLGRYFVRMFVWHDFVNWPFMYYFQQIFITIGIVFAGTITASLIALPLSFFAARNVMSTPLLRPISVAVRRLLDIFTRHRYGDLGADLRARCRHGAVGRGTGDCDARRRAARQAVCRRARSGG
ncbi:ABC-type phosphate/phosphonate transport system, permease component [Serratia plymuthica]|uniref:ABC-type phosphate/phosphonate transport system, permease component n=1 Tax=Serratia plymuthica TaxID=82996 RepID=A0A2X4U762_SERPL|nr:ABC-type phosphate/phosphonate transport system, permease component [Serratia plymuthica]